jgi:hypothetical protein
LQVPPYISWKAEEADSRDGIHWAVVTWWWDIAVGGASEAPDPEFLLIQSPDAVAVGRLMGWWRRPCHVVMAATTAGMTAADLMAQLVDAREDPCPTDPMLLPDLQHAVTGWIPLWVPARDELRQRQVTLLCQERAERAERAAKAAAMREERQLHPREPKPKAKRAKRRAEPEEEEETGTGGGSSSGGDDEGGPKAPPGAGAVSVAATAEPVFYPQVRATLPGRTRFPKGPARPLLKEAEETPEGAAATSADWAWDPDTGREWAEGDEYEEPHLTQLPSQERDVPGEWQIDLGALVGPGKPVPAAVGKAGDKSGGGGKRVDWAAVQRQALSQPPVDLLYRSDEEEEIEETTHPRDLRRREEERRQAERERLAEERAAQQKQQQRQQPKAQPEGAPVPVERPRAPAGGGEATGEPARKKQRAGDKAGGEGPETRLLPFTPKTKPGAGAAGGGGKKSAKTAADTPHPGQPTLQEAFARGTATPPRPTSGGTTSPSPGSAPATPTPAAPAAAKAKAKPKPSPQGAEQAEAAEATGGRTSLRGAVAARLGGLTPPGSDRRTRGDRDPPPPAV